MDDPTTTTTPITMHTSSPPPPSSLTAFNQGIWSQREHDMFLEAIRAFPQGPWKRIADFVGTRSVRQVQTHAQKYNEKVLRRMRTGPRDRKTCVRVEHRIDDDVLGFYTKPADDRVAGRRDAAAAAAAAAAVVAAAATMTGAGMATAAAVSMAPSVTDAAAIAPSLAPAPAPAVTANATAASNCQARLARANGGIHTVEYLSGDSISNDDDDDDDDDAMDNDFDETDASSEAMDKPRLSREDELEALLREDEVEGLARESSRAAGFDALSIDDSLDYLISVLLSAE